MIGYEIPEPGISVRMINGGTKENIIPDRCVLTLDNRMIPGATTEMVMNELQEIIDSLIEREKDLKIEVNMRTNYWDSYIISEDEPIVQATIASVKQVTDKKPEIDCKGASTDASHLFHLGGISTVLFDPGNPHLSDKIDEHASIENLLLSTEALILFFNELLN